jgi:methanethiol S-methyltransferase
MRYLLIASLWAAYCALHSYLISIRFTERMNQLFKNYYAFYRLFYVTISIVLFIPLSRLTAHLDPQVVVMYSFPFSVIRYTLQSGSLLMFFWAFFVDYDCLSFFGIRQIVDFGKTQKTDPAQKIKKAGLLSITRHPMYFALIIYLWCHTFRVMDVVVNTVLTIYVLIGTKLEEKKLVLEFGEAYVRYQHEVPMLIPFIKPVSVDHPLSRGNA